MKKLGLMTLSLMLASPALAGGAGQPAARPATCKSISATISADPQFSTLRTALSTAGLTNVLAGSGSYTVFAPTNAAFAKLPSKDLATLLNNPQRLAQVLRYHVVDERATAAELRGAVAGTTLQGQDVTVKVNGQQILINNARIVRADVGACNGVIHVVDTVLMPKLTATTPASGKPAPKPAATVSAPVAAPVAFDVTRIPALPLSGATQTGVTSATVTAPAQVVPVTTNTTVNTETTVNTDTTVTNTVENTTTEEVEQTTETEVVTVETETNTEVETVEVETENAETDTTETEVTEVSSNTIYDVVAADDQFSILRSLLSDADLTELLTSGEYTLFAPTDAAFDALPEGTLAAIASDAEVLKSLLTYHVVPGRLSAEQVQAGNLTTAAGTALTIQANLAPVVESSNGVIYPVDAVLLPAGFVIPNVEEVAPVESTTVAPVTTTTTTTTTEVAPVTTTQVTTTTTTTEVAPATVGNIVTVADVNTLLQDARFSTVRDLLTQTELLGGLTSGEYTVFLPTNDAFAKMDAGKVASLRGNSDLLRQVLNYHIIRGRKDVAGLVAGPLLTNEGSSFSLVGDANGLQLDGVTIGGTERIDAGNATIYVVDSLLLPPSLR